jgi:hypothetical protein
MTEPEALILSLPSPRKWITEVFRTSWPAHYSGIWTEGFLKRSATRQ